VKSTSASIVLLIVGSTAGVLGQQSKPSFEVASVRPTLSKRLSEINAEFQPRRFVATMVPLRWLIALAYAGRFDYEVRFSVAAGRLASLAAAPPVPDLVRALRDQLGLKLEPVIAPVDILVVDSAEHPTTN
jgi:hypothetical protein